METLSKVCIWHGVKSKLPLHLLHESTETFGLGADSAWSFQARQAMTCMRSPTAGKAELGKRSERTRSCHSHCRPRKSSSALDIG